ncbi:4191_t:CDS:2 [Entrophospora sp. SA101]|nr:4191_t:CDS:2 [Entrophospora sp. SA101]
MDVSTVLTPPSSPTCASQHYECAVCKILYKTKSGLMHHNTIVRKYNLKHEGLCRLPSEVITEFKAFLVHVIQSKLKGHFSQSANLLGNSNWGRKFFDNDQQTFVVLFDTRDEVEANQETIFDQNGRRIPKNRLKNLIYQN